MVNKKNISLFLSEIVMLVKLLFSGDLLKVIFLLKNKLKSPPLILKSKISIYIINLPNSTFGILPDNKNTDPLSLPILKDVMVLS